MQVSAFPLMRVTPMASLSPSEYLEKHLPTWDRSDKVMFIRVLEQTLERFDRSEAYNTSDLYQRWLQWRYGVPSETPFTQGDWYCLALDLLTLTHSIGR
jgi:hypothetical protein